MRLFSSLGLRAHPSLRRPDRIDLLAMGLIVMWGITRLAPGLGHERIWAWDESLHQTVTRHVHDHPFAPMLYDDPVHPLKDLRLWWGSNIWLLKPPGAFWLGALFMNFTGVLPVAFRIGGFLSQLISALTIYLLASAVTRRGWALAAAIGFLSLPLGWTFTQARFVGDELDLEITGAISVAMLCLFLSIERRSWRWAAAAGVATGVAYLLKTFLALTPVGAAGVLWILGLIGFCRGPRLKHVVILVAVAFAVAGPWNIYAAVKWPDVYGRAFTHTLGFMSQTAPEQGVQGWRRPIDAIFNECNQSAFGPLPQVLSLLMGIWLAIRALRKRELVVVGTALWIWSTWIGHTFASVKMSSHIWNAVVAGFVGVAVVLGDLWESRPLALGVAGGVALPWLLPALPFLARVRESLPMRLAQTREIPGLCEGLIIVAAGACVGMAAQRIRPIANSIPAWAVGVLPALGLCWWVLWKATVLQSEQAIEAAKENNVIYSREVGRAIDRSTPAKSLVLLDHDFDPNNQIEHFNLMFWSDRLVHDGRDPQDYPQAGYHPYLVSPVAEPFAPLAEVPADAWMRAYDMAIPTGSPATIPSGATPLELKSGNLSVLGFASGRSDPEHDHYAFFVHPVGVPTALRVTFQTDQGAITTILQPESTLRVRNRLADVPWFVMPAVGPPQRTVKEIYFGVDPTQRFVFPPSRG